MVLKLITYLFSKYYDDKYSSVCYSFRKKYTVKEVSVEMNEREGGVSSIRAWKNIYYMINVCLALLAIKIRRYKKCHRV